MKCSVYLSLNFDTSLKITNLRSQLHLPGVNELTDCGPVMPYGDRVIVQHWLR